LFGHCHVVDYDPTESIIHITTLLTPGHMRNFRNFTFFQIMTLAFLDLLEWGNYAAPCRHLFNLFWLGINQEHQGHFILWRYPDWSKICQQPRAEWCAVSGRGASLLRT